MFYEITQLCFSAGMDTKEDILLITQSITALLFIVSELLGMSKCQYNSVGEVVANGFTCIWSSRPNKDEEIEIK
jgi:hypothetical protein